MCNQHERTNETDANPTFLLLLGSPTKGMVEPGGGHMMWGAGLGLWFAGSRDVWGGPPQDPAFKNSPSFCRYQAKASLA